MINRCGGPARFFAKIGNSSAIGVAVIVERSFVLRKLRKARFSFSLPLSLRHALHFPLCSSLHPNQPLHRRAQSITPGNAPLAKLNALCSLFARSCELRYDNRESDVTTYWDDRRHDVAPIVRVDKSLPPMKQIESDVT